MLFTAIVLFLIAAVFGLMTLIAVLKNNPTSRPTVLIHGAVAAIALLIVLVATVQATGPAPVASLILFLIAAAGGFILFAVDLQKKPLPKWLALVHPVVAALGLVSLIVFVVAR